MAIVFPSSPTNGQIFSDPVTGNRYTYDSSNSVWKFSSNNVGMTVGAAPPPTTTVAPGAMWYNTNTGRTFILYDDGDSKQWVENVPAVGSFDSSTVAGYANAAVLPAVTPAYNTANAAFGKANTALQNTSGTFAGSLVVTGNMIAGNVGIGTTSPVNKLVVSDSGAKGIEFRPNDDSRAFILAYDRNAGAFYPLHLQGNDILMRTSTGGTVATFLNNGNIQMLTAGAKILNSSGNPILQQTGSILQVVTAFDTGTSTTNSGWTNTGLTASITPTSSTSKILVLVSWTGRSGSNRMGHRIDRSGTVIEGQQESLGVLNNPQRMFTHYLDSPATTSSRTYTLQIYQPNTSGTIQTNDAGANVGLNSHNEITLIEIAA